MACLTVPLAALLSLLPLLLAFNPTLTGETARRAGSNQHSQTASVSGPILLQDIYALEKLRRFNTERIPERVVHPRGVAAHGFFKLSNPIPALTSAPFLTTVPKTEVLVRFSTVIHSRGSPETLRDPRGFAVKFFTGVGNFDLVGNNLPVFFIRDHIKFPDMVHSLKPDPVTNIQDPNRFFDFFSAVGGQSTHMLTYVYSDLGIPANYRQMDGNSVHSYKLVRDGKPTYVKFRWFSNQGVKNLTLAQAEKTQGRDFNHATRDLYDAIKRRDYPSWRLAVQVLPDDQFDTLDFDPLDATKEWPEGKFPFKEVGTMTLNRIPDNFHMGSEQSAFSPGNFLPGMVEPSEDRLLQGRLVSYHETQTHRHGSNVFNRLPINAPRIRTNSYSQDGVMVFGHDWKGSVNYEPNNDPNGFREDPDFLYSSRRVCGRYVQQEIQRTLNFRQAGELYRRFDVTQRKNLITNLASDLGQVKNRVIKETMCAHFYKADRDYGKMISAAVDCNLRRVKRIASKLKE